MANKEWVIYAAMLFIGVVFAIESLRLGLGSTHRPRSGFLPFFTCSLLSFITFFSLIKYFLKARGEKGKDRKEHFGGNVFNLVIILVGLVIYVLVLPLLGYLLSTFVLLIFLFKAGGIRKWTFILLYAFLTTSITYLVFSSWLNLRFPKGSLGF